MSNFTGTVLVTGGAVNLGYQAALKIAQKHPEYRIVIASRTETNAASTTMNQTLRRDQVIYQQLDLADLSHVRSFVDTYSKNHHPPLKALLLNAGLQFPRDHVYNAAGVEKTFAINHIGHALLFHLLTPHLASDAHIVITSSGTHDPAQKSGLPDAVYASAEELAHPSGASLKYAGRQRYATSKLCNVLWMKALDRRLAAANTDSNDGKSPGTRRWTVNAFDPGLMPGTGLARDANAFEHFLWNHVLTHLIPLLRLLVLKHTNTVQESGAELAALALGDSSGGRSGEYYEGYKVIGSSALSYDEAKQEDLWAWTLQCVARDEGEREKFARLDRSFERM